MTTRYDGVRRVLGSIGVLIAGAVVVAPLYPGGLGTTEPVAAGVHYPHDVVAGGALGATFVAAILLIANPLAGERRCLTAQRSPGRCRTLA